MSAGTARESIGQEASSDGDVTESSCVERFRLERLRDPEPALLKERAGELHWSSISTAGIVSHKSPTRKK